MKHRYVYITIVLAAILTLSCSLLGGGDRESKPTDVPDQDIKPTLTADSPDVELNKDDLSERSIDGMEIIRIPAGEFLMGDDNSAFKPEKPAHLVTLDEYWIDRYEVKNSQYRLCIAEKVCTEPKNWWNEDLNGDDIPVLVPWEDAQTYCQWAGGRLPTEAEWEKAMRGTDGRIWPWGNDFVDNRANLSSDADGYKALAPVGSFPDDKSPYGLLDAAGNAAEWVSDWFSANYYETSPSNNPTGPGSGTQRVHRAPIANGGGGPEKCRTVARYAGNLGWEFGIRCVADDLPDE